MNRRGMLTALLCGGVCALQTGRPVAAAVRPKRALFEEPARVVAALADVIMPRTDTPGAIDVGVVEWIELMIAEYYSPAECSKLLLGLREIDALAVAMDGKPLADLSRDRREHLVARLDAQDEPASAALRSYAQIKRLTIDGYFTSEVVQRDVLKVQIAPGRFDGCSPVASGRSLTG